MNSKAEPFRGQPSLLLSHSCGDSIRVMLQGAQVVSWTTGGRERLYLSDKSIFDGRAAIRGGVPVCFPQFNMRGPSPHLPKHGFARNLPWELSEPAAMQDDAAVITLRLVDRPATRDIWPQAFELQLRIELRPGALKLLLSVRNTDDKPLDFSGALHSYLAVDDIASTTLAGLGGQAEWDAVRDQHGMAAELLRFEGEFDRVYATAAAPLSLRHAGGTLAIAQSESWANTVVWNPGAVLCATLPDLPPDGYQKYLCVEAAQVFEPIRVPPGCAWEGWQMINVVAT